ncbi:MAG: hypothetical protein IJN87_10250 [Firmicutes bacterium]|nr:hypothetical protein [Bacillota bacterium]
MGGELVTYCSPPFFAFMRVFEIGGGEFLQSSPPRQAFMQFSEVAGGEIHHQRVRKPALGHTLVVNF